MQHEEERLDAVLASLDRNPHAFWPKLSTAAVRVALLRGQIVWWPPPARLLTESCPNPVGAVLSGQGAQPDRGADDTGGALPVTPGPPPRACRCERSKCLKKYCECFQVRLSFSLPCPSQPFWRRRGWLVAERQPLHRAVQVHRLQGLRWAHLVYYSSA